MRFIMMSAKYGLAAMSEVLERSAAATVTRAALYMRVSTSDQTCENQRADLMKVAAEQGWQVTESFADAGISGAKGREDRPALNAMLEAAERGDIDVIMVWSVDRLSRSLTDLVKISNTIRVSRTQLYVHLQKIDTNTTFGKFLFNMFGAMAEWERDMIKDRVNAGLRRSRAEGKRPGPKTLQEGRPEMYDQVVSMLRSGMPVFRVHTITGVGHGTVRKIYLNLLAEKKKS